MMSEKGDAGCIEHEGIVQDSGNNTVTVKIVSESACSGCHAERGCSMVGQVEKIINIPGSYNVVAGDKVTVQMKQSAGFTALLLGYLLPLIIMMSLLVVLIASSVPELTAGLCSIGILIPYYLVLRMFRNRISRRFTFTLKA